MYTELLKGEIADAFKAYVNGRLTWEEAMDIIHDQEEKLEAAGELTYDDYVN